MATKKQRKRKQKARLNTEHTVKYRELKAQQREKNDREAEMEAICRAMLKFVDEKQAALQALREDSKEIATALGKLSTRMKGLAHDAEGTLTAFRADPPSELATEALKEDRDEALARVAELEEALWEAQERLRERVATDHRRDAIPPKWLARAERTFAGRHEVPESYDFFEEIGKRALRWAKDVRVLGSGLAESVSEEGDDAVGSGDQGDD